MRRPGNVGSVEGWTSHKIPKGIVQNCLEELAKSGELTVAGKVGKVYWFNQVSHAAAAALASAVKIVV